MPTPEQTRHPLAVLVVDDSVDTAESEADLLAFQGHAVCVATNGEEALRCVEAQPPDVVLLDIRLPGMDGYAIAKAIRERCEAVGKRPLIVAVTGCGSEADRQHSAEAGFDLHLVKPVDPALLIGVLERYRRLLAPSIPAAELDSLTEEPPDERFNYSPHYLAWQSV
jgi:CheY-like chemotaxis protein